MSNVTTAKQGMEVISATGQEFEQQARYLEEIKEKVEEFQKTAETIKHSVDGAIAQQMGVKTYFEGLVQMLGQNELPHDKEDSVVENIETCAETPRSLSEILNTMIQAGNACMEIINSAAEVCEKSTESANGIATQIANIIGS